MERALRRASSSLSMIVMVCGVSISGVSVFVPDACPFSRTPVTTMELPSEMSAFVSATALLIATVAILAPSNVSFSTPNPTASHNVPDVPTDHGRTYSFIENWLARAGVKLAAVGGLWTAAPPYIGEAAAGEMIVVRI